MGAKFIVDHRCTVKTSLTLTGLIEALKYQGILRRVSELAASGTWTAGSEEARLDLVFPPEVGLHAALTVRDLHTQASALSEHRETCRQCPSSLDGHVGGCIAYVPYPISEGMEYLLWLTAARALKGGLPPALLPDALAFARRAQRLEQTPFSAGLRARGDLIGARQRIHQHGSLWKRQRLTSSQVLDAFFINGLLAGEELKAQAGFLSAALAVARAMEPAMRTEERRLALIEDVEAYVNVHDLLTRALRQSLGVYVWP